MRVNPAGTSRAQGQSAACHLSASSLVSHAHLFPAWDMSRDMDFPVAQMVKNLPAMKETRVQSLGREDPLEKGMANHPVFLTGESHEQRSLSGYSLWGCKESDVTERRTHSPWLDIHTVLKLVQKQSAFWFLAPTTSLSSPQSFLGTMCSEVMLRSLSTNLLSLRTCSHQIS